MKRSLRILPAAAGFMMAYSIAGSICGGPAGFIVAAQPDPAKPAYYDETVKPILETNCYRCHGGANHRGGYNMNTRESLLKGGHKGGAVVPGHPESSLLVKLVRHEGPADDPMPMPPPPKPKLTDADIAVLEKWIKAGAVTPADPLFTAPAQ